MAPAKRKQKKDKKRIERGDVNGKITSFDYDKLEPTNDRDTVNYWKEVDTACRALTQIGLSVNEASFLELAFKASKELSRSKNQAEVESHNIQQLQAEVQREKIVARSAEMTRISRDAEITIWKQRVKRFGDHTSECQYIREMDSTRPVDIEEKDLCNCGWYEIKTQI